MPSDVTSSVLSNFSLTYEPQIRFFFQQVHPFAKDEKNDSQGSAKQPSNTDYSHGESSAQQDGAEETMASTVAIAKKGRALESRMVSPELYIILCTLIFLSLILSSPNNMYSSRAVFEVPLLTPTECRQIIDLANAAAKRNYDDAVQKWQKEKQMASYSLLAKPEGWRKDRHIGYPTTDLNLVTDPFRTEDRVFLKGLLDARLAPIIERVYGINQGSLRAIDMFVVRYDDNGQNGLRQHCDEGTVSFNVLLNDEFEGGGTRFHDRIMRTSFTVNPQPGQALVHNANILHEGLPILSGTRYILVGFVSVDRIDPLTTEKTGLSLYSSWLSVHWIQVRIKESHKASMVTESRGDWNGVSLFQLLLPYLDSFLWSLGDILSQPFHAKLVESANKMRFLAALDRMAEGRRMMESTGQAAVIRRPSWFKGQQLTVDFYGRLMGVWKSREDAGEDRFHEEL